MENNIKTILFLALALFYAGLSYGQPGGTAGSSQAEDKIEQLLREAFAVPADYDHLLAEALTYAETLPVERAAFFQIYIVQSRFRIEASLVSEKLDSLEVNSVPKERIIWLREKFIESIEVMSSVKQYLKEKKQSVSSSDNKAAGIQALIDRCDFCNGWAWYSLSTISSDEDKAVYLQSAEKIFTSFLGRSYEQSNTPVIVNCLYGKGLCLRDSDRYYDLITMLDNMPGGASEAVKFARLRLAAAVKLNLSIDILRVVQDYFNKDNSRALGPGELEMLLNCIESVVELLERDLPDSLKDKLREQLILAIERVEGSGSYWQNRLAPLIDGLELASPFAKVVQIRKVLNSDSEVDFENIYNMARQGQLLSLDTESEHILEFLYLQSVSAWNLFRYEQSRSSAIEYIARGDDPNRIIQLANIVVQSNLKLILDDSSRYDIFRAELEEYHLKGYIEKEQYNWFAGSLMINAGKYQEGYVYFSDSNLRLNPPIMKQYGLLIALVPMLRENIIEPEQAVEQIVSCCRVFIDSKEFQYENIIADSLEAVSQTLDILYEGNRNDLVKVLINLLEQMPHIRQDAYARITAVDLSVQVADNEDITGIVNRISQRTLQHNPLVFNSLVKLASKAESTGGFSDDIMITVYNLMLSSKQLDIDNSVAVRIYLAQCYFRQKRYKDFVDIFRIIEARYKQYVTAANYYQLAFANQKLLQYEQAGQYWSIVQLNNVVMNEGGKEALFNKILCLYLDKQIEKARQILALALLRDPGLNEDARFGKLRALVQSGDNIGVETTLQWYENDQQVKIKAIEKE